MVQMFMSSKKNGVWKDSPYSHKHGLSRLTFELRVSRHRQEDDDDANLKSSHTNTGTLLPYEVTTI